MGQMLYFWSNNLLTIFIQIVFCLFSCAYHYDGSIYVWDRQTYHVSFKNNDLDKNIFVLYEFLINL